MNRTEPQTAREDDAAFWVYADQQRDALRAVGDPRYQDRVEWCRRRAADAARRKRWLASERGRVEASKGERA